MPPIISHVNRYRICRIYRRYDPCRAPAHQRDQAYQQQIRPLERHPGPLSYPLPSNPLFQSTILFFVLFSPLLMFQVHGSAPPPAGSPPPEFPLSARFPSFQLPPAWSLRDWSPSSAAPGASPSTPPASPPHRCTSESPNLPPPAGLNPV